MPELDDSTLVAFVDGELDATTMREVAGLIAADSGAQEKVRRLRASAVLVQAAFADPAYQQVAPNLVDMVARPASPEMAIRRPRRLALALAASAVAATLVGFAGGLTVSRTWAPAEAPFTRQLLNEVADYHVVYAEEAEPLGEIPASRSDEIAAWFGRVLRRSVQIPDLSRVGLEFQGARLLVVDGRPVAQLLYAWPHQPARPLGFCITSGEPDDATIRDAHRKGVNLAVWGGNGYTYVLVGWVAADMLTALASELRPKMDAL